MITTARQLYEFLCSRVRKNSCTRQRLISRVAAQSRDDDIRISVHFCTQRMLLTIAICVDHCITARSIERSRTRGSLHDGQAERFDIAGIFVTFPFPLVIRAVAMREAERAYVFSYLHCIGRKYSSKNYICLFWHIRYRYNGYYNIFFLNIYVIFFYII